MTTYDFIFFNQPRYRISRHTIFWLCWFVFVVLTWQIPMNDIFPNWNVKARMDFVQKKHGVDFITFRGGLANMIWEITYKQLRVLLCHMAFTYAIIYYILPLYISNRKKWILTTGNSFLYSLLFLHCSILLPIAISQTTLPTGPGVGFCEDEPCPDLIIKQE